MLRQIALSISTILCLANAQSVVAQTNLPQGAKQEIDSGLKEQSQAANAHDTDLFLHSFFHSPELTFVVFGEVIHGFDALHAEQLRWWKNGKADAVYTARDPVEYHPLAPGLVLVTQAMRSRRTGPDGKPVEKDFVVTTIWKSLPEGWRVIYGHESWSM